MLKIKTLFLTAVFLVLYTGSAPAFLSWPGTGGNMDLALLWNLYKPLDERLETGGFEKGNRVFIRIFKEEAVLELWLSQGQDKFSLFAAYPICAMSGKLGPKLKQGDLQAPEGFYAVGLKQLNPHSRFHLSFNIGYPNAYDRFHGHNGNFIMVHGNCVSAGCFAMTDAYIEEIYTLVEQSLKKASSLSACIFFRSA